MSDDMRHIRAGYNYNSLLADADHMREIQKLRAELAAAREALDEARTVLSWMLLEGMDEVIPETCPVEYKWCVDAVARIDAALNGGEDE